MVACNRKQIFYKGGVQLSENLNQRNTTSADMRSYSAMYAELLYVLHCWNWMRRRKESKKYLQQKNAWL